MNYSIMILKKELKEWQQELRDDRAYYKGEDNYPSVIKIFRVSEYKIKDLYQAIEILEKAKTH
jgi:hypothetical protein